MKGLSGVVDGKLLLYDDHDDCDIQRAYYESCARRVYEMFILDFNSFCEASHAGMKLLRGCHDAKVAAVSGLIYPSPANQNDATGNAFLNGSSFVAKIVPRRSKKVPAPKSGETRYIMIFNGLSTIEVCMKQYSPTIVRSLHWA